MKNKLKIRLEVWGKTLVMQILEQDERFRKGEHLIPPREYTARNGLVVGSRGYPQLRDSGKLVLLRGDDNSNNENVTLLFFDSETNAIKHKIKILEALEDWAKNAPEFREEEVPAPDPGGNVYVF